MQFLQHKNRLLKKKKKKKKKNPASRLVKNWSGLEDKNSRHPAVFTARGVVLFASKESDSNRSELTKQVTDAQLAKAFPLAEKFELTKLDQSRPRAPLKKNRHLGGFFCSTPRDFGLLAVSFRGELQRLLFGETGFLLGR